MLLQYLGLVHVGTCKWGWAPNLWQFRAGSMTIEHFNSVVQTNLSIEIDVVRDVISRIPELSLPAILAVRPSSD